MTVPKFSNAKDKSTFLNNLHWYILCRANSIGYSDLDIFNPFNIKPYEKYSIEQLLKLYYNVRQTKLKK
jgi:hypothetical protein